jgi:hypothetical protein
MDFMYGSGGEKQKAMLREGWFLGYLRFCGVIMVLLASILVFFGIYHFL